MGPIAMQCYLTMLTLQLVVELRQTAAEEERQPYLVIPVRTKTRRRRQETNEAEVSFLRVSEMKGIGDEAADTCCPMRFAKGATA